MYPIQIREDYVYKNRRGEYVGPLTRSEDPVFRWQAPTTKMYQPDGRFYGNGVECPQDIVEEVGPVTKAVGIGVPSAAGMARLFGSVHPDVDVNGHEYLMAQQKLQAEFCGVHQQKPALYVVARETLPAMTLEEARAYVLKDKMVGARICKIVETVSQEISFDPFD